MQKIPVKQILLIVGFLLIVATAGFFLYYLFFATPTTTVAPTEEELAGTAQVGGGLGGGLAGKPVSETALGQAISEKKITKIAPIEGAKPDEIAKGGITAVQNISFDVIPTYHVSTNGLLLAYDADSGLFYKINAVGDKEILSEKEYKNVSNIIWATNDEQAILEFPDGSNILFNFKTGEQITLPQSWKDFAFSANGDKIVFKDMDSNPEYNWLAIANPDGSGQTYIEHMGEKSNQVLPGWSPNNQVIALFKSGGTGITTEIQMIGKNKENLASFDAKGLGFDYQWSPSGEQILYSAFSPVDNMDPYLYIVDAGSNNIGYNHKKINLKTWVDKCTFGDNATAYCAVPKNLPNNSGPAPEVADSIPDYIYKVDLTTGLTSFIAEPEYAYTIDKINISPDGSLLYFTDKQTNTLHSVQLK